MEFAKRFRSQLSNVILFPGLQEIKIFSKIDNFFEENSEDSICIAYGKEMEYLVNKLCLFYAVCCFEHNVIDDKEETTVRISQNEVVTIVISSPPELCFTISKKTHQKVDYLKLSSLDETISFAFDLCQIFLYGITRNPIKTVAIIDFVLNEFSQNCNFEKWIENIETYEDLNLEKIQRIKSLQLDLFYEKIQLNDFICLVSVQNTNIVLFAKLAGISNYLSQNPLIHQSLNIENLLVQFKQNEVEALGNDLLRKMPKSETSSSHLSGNTKKRSHGSMQAEENSERCPQPSTSREVFTDINQFAKKRGLDTTESLE